LTFETWDQSTDESSVWAANLDTGDMSLIGTSMFVAVPSYTGDDGAIVYTLDDAAVGFSTNSGGSLVVQDVEADRITPTGELQLWLEDAAYGVVYRRGAFDTTPLAECEDGIDNDGDELTDFPANPGCESADDPLEVPEPAAALLQLAALAILALLRRRGRGERL